LSSNLHSPTIILFSSKNQLETFVCWKIVKPPTKDPPVINLLTCTDYGQTLTMDLTLKPVPLNNMTKVKLILLFWAKWTKIGSDYTQALKVSEATNGLNTELVMNNNKLNKLKILNTWPRDSCNPTAKEAMILSKTISSKLLWKSNKNTTWLKQFMETNYYKVI
jgi:hypothetical protein